MKEKESTAYELLVKSSTSQLAAIRSFIQLHAEEHNMPAQTIQAVILAVDEAATNIVKHAYHLKPDNDIKIRFEMAGDECTITLTDYGDPFDPSLVPEPDMKEYLKQRKVGGLGLFLIRTLMDDLEYKTDQAHYNQLTIKKKIA